MRDEGLKMGNAVDKVKTQAMGETTPVAERIAAEQLPNLTELYGPLSPVVNLDGSIDIYDQDGELVATVFEDGEIELYCDPPAGEPECCDDLNEGYTYNDPWMIPDEWFEQGDPFEQNYQVDEGTAVQNSSKKFADASDIFDETEETVDVEELFAEEEIPVETQANDVDIDVEPEPQAEVEVALESDSADPAEIPETPVPEVPQVAHQEPQGAVAPEVMPPMAAAQPQMTAGEVIGAVVDEVKSQFAESRLLTVDKDHPRAERVGRSIEGAVEVLASSFERYFVMPDEGLIPSFAQAVKGAVRYLKRGLGRKGRRPVLLAEADGPQDAADSASSRARRRRASAVGFEANPISSGRASSPFAAGAAALHDGNHDPYVAALSHMDKGGPPYFLSAQTHSPTAPAVSRESSHDRVTAARSQGDAHHHHGEQEGDGRREDPYEMYDAEVEELDEVPA